MLQLPSPKCRCQNTTVTFVQRWTHSGCSTWLSFKAVVILVLILNAHITIFRAFNFRCLSNWRKIFNSEKFPNLRYPLDATKIRVVHNKSVIWWLRRQYGWILTHQIKNVCYIYVVVWIKLNNWLHHMFKVLYHRASVKGGAQVCFCFYKV